MTVQAKTLILLNFFIADSPAKHQQSGKLGESFRFLVRELFEFIIATGSARMDVYKK